MGLSVKDLIVSKRNGKTVFLCIFMDRVTVKTLSINLNFFPLWQPNEIYRHRTRLGTNRFA